MLTFKHHILSWTFNCSIVLSDKEIEEIRFHTPIAIFDLFKKIFQSQFIHPIKKPIVKQIKYILLITLRLDDSTELKKSLRQVLERS